MAECSSHQSESLLVIVSNPRLSCHGYHIAEVSKMVWDQGN